MVSVDLALAHDSYAIDIEPGVLAQLGALTRAVAPHERAALIVDEAVAESHGRVAAEALRRAGYNTCLVTMPAGEQHKTLDTVRDLYDTLLEHRLERKSPIVALGGGITGDTAGFVAATYLRGVPLIQCPTTLLAMVDASIGGKVGVNVPQGKNLVGAFHQPRRVVIDPETLSTLPTRELRCGLAECVKHAMIRDGALLDWIEAHAEALLAVEPGAMSELIERNVRIKAAVVGEDEKETGVRAHLNFGHTFAHAIEATTGYEAYLHGEAVAIGMVAATQLAVDRQLAEPTVRDRLMRVLTALGLPTRAEAHTLASDAKLLEAMRLDKKVADGRVRLILPRRVGEVTIVDDADDTAIIAAWESVR